MERLIFNTLEEAENYSRDNYSGSNIVCDNKTCKVLIPAKNTDSIKNPKLYVRNGTSQLIERKNQKKLSKLDKKFTSFSDL